MVAKDSKTAAAVAASSYDRKPPKMSRGQSIKLFLYNEETGAIMGRTPSSWGKIGLFYLIFYGVLAALVAICFWIFYLTIDPRIPTYRLERSLIGTNPGLGFRPLPPAENVESSLIWYKASDKGNYLPWVNSLKKFVQEYKTPGKRPGLGANIFTCDYNHYPGPNQVCKAEVTEKDFGVCTPENSFNFHKTAPCIFLKLNKIYGWRPEFYNDTQNLPMKMPEGLKKHITNVPDVRRRNTIWVSCEGENPADQENVGPIKIFPEDSHGFPGFYYPYENAEGYLSPLVAVHFQRPRTGILINVECKAWAKNIVHNRQNKLGSVHFELMID